MSTDYTEYYDVFANLFKIGIENLGGVYLVGPEIDETIDVLKTIKRSGNYYSYEPEYGEPCNLTASIVLGFIRKYFRHTIRANGYLSKGHYTLYKEEDVVRHDNEDIIKLFKGFKYRILSLENEYYLCIDPACVVFSAASIEYLADRGISLQDLQGFSVRYIDDEGHRISGYLLQTEKDNGQITSTIRFYRRPNSLNLPDVVKLPADTLYPEARPEILESFLNKLGTHSSIIRIIRRLSFLSSRTSSRDRLVETLRLAEKLVTEIFPLEFGGFKVSLSTEPIIVKM